MVLHCGINLYEGLYTKSMGTFTRFCIGKCTNGGWFVHFVLPQRGNCPVGYLEKTGES